MSLSTNSTRTYNPNVRVGNWNEEICLEEDILKDFLEKQENGSLLIQRTQSLMQTLLAKTDIESSDQVKIGSSLNLVNPGREGLEPNGDKQMENLPRQLLKGRNKTSVAINVDEWPVGGLETLVSSPLALSAASQSDVPCVRNTFKIVAEARSTGENLHYGDKFALQSVLGQGDINKDLYIFTDRLRLGQASSGSNRKMPGGCSPLQLVPTDKGAAVPYGAYFTVESFDPLLRLEHEGLPVPKNEPVLIKHCATGQHMAVIDDSAFRTPFGSELSVGAQTFLNSHKAERDNNYWFIR